MNDSERDKFVTHYPFSEDRSRDERILKSVRVGGVYVSRLEVKPQAVIGNIYYQTTNLIFFVEKGECDVKFVQMSSRSELEKTLTPGQGIMHVPPKNAFAIKNTSNENGVVIVFSDKPLRAGDDIPHTLY